MSTGTPFLSTADIAHILQWRGLGPCLRGLMETLRADFMRWEDFDKSARVAHHSPVGFVSPIQIAQPEVSTRAPPARRMPQAPPRKLPDACQRSSSQGPMVMDTEVPSANRPMMAAPSSALAERDASNKAEYSRPQGMSAQPAPNA